MENLNSSQSQIQSHPIEKPAAVTVFGVLNCVFGGIGILCTPFNVGMILVGKTVDVVWGYKIYMLIGSIVGIGFSAWLLSLGIGLLKLRRWAWRGSIIYSIIVILWGIVGIGLNLVAFSSGWITVSEGQFPAMAGGMCGGIMGLLYPVLLLIFMQTAQVKQAFEGGERSV